MAGPNDAPDAGSTTPPAVRRPVSRSVGCLVPLLLTGLLVSLFFNCGLGLTVLSKAEFEDDDDGQRLVERHFLGDQKGSAKVAVVRVSGVISETGIAYPLRQIERAAKDKAVKAVVLRVDSPGGTVTASHDLYLNLLDLRDNTGRRFVGTGSKPIVVSTGGLAASGGYYIAAAGSPIYVEPTTITGSIGVFAALPNVSEFLNKNGVRVELVKAGGVKGAGSFFHELAPAERQTWQDTVDHAYDQFLTVVAKGRPGLTKEILRDEKVVDTTVPKRDVKGNVVNKPNGDAETIPYVRYRADGGTFTPDQALKFGLADKIGGLPEAVAAAADAAGLTSYHAVVYDKPQSLFDLVTNSETSSRASVLSPESVASTLTPRLWYLLPAADGAGVVSSAGR